MLAVLFEIVHMFWVSYLGFCLFFDIYFGERCSIIGMSYSWFDDSV